MSADLLTYDERKTLISIARQAIEQYARTGVAPDLPASLPAALTGGGGGFVTLRQRGRLRGCIGTFEGEGALASTIQKMALAAGWEDPRFPTLSVDELSEIELEISVLSPLREIDDLDAIEVGRDGLYVTRGSNRGVLLPQVAVEQAWDREQFLSHTCQKAGLEGGAWKKGDLKIESFTAQVFGEEEDR